MAILKCKICGGDMEVSPDKSFGTCEYCGTTMTLPKIDDEQRAAAFNRGNHFRRTGEFDKALQVYERIITEDPNDAEAHWCCALCHYGIEWVEDPATLEYVPTCHRASFDSFLEDVDYLAALENSDGLTKRQYQKDAAKIADVQRGILATSQNEEPFDVFICYKETDDVTKERTKDSLDAQEIYYQLTNEGYRVFFSRITLEDKVGAEYEPYIFAALNSAKVMVAIGSKPEYFNAVWVKNEWSRFLAMMRKDRSKLLLPCYKNMDPYDLPEQLSVLQSYDMTKIGFVQDLIRGIKKVVNKNEPKATVVKETVVESSNANIAPLLKRAFMFLEDGNWQEADEYCEKVLDQDPENARAYLGKLMAEQQVKKQEHLKNCEQPFDKSNNYQKALRFGDEKLKAELAGYIQFINQRNENARLTGIYNSAVSAMKVANTEEAFKSAAKKFRSISGFQDADELATACLEKAEECRKDAIYSEACREKNEGKYVDAMRHFVSIAGWKDADEQCRPCEEAVEKLYRDAVSQMNAAKSWAECQAAWTAFAAIRHYKDTDEWIEKCLAKVEVCRKDAIYDTAMMNKDKANYGSLYLAIKGFQEIPGWKDSEQQIELCRKEIERIKQADREAAEKERKRSTRNIVIFLAAGVAIIAFLIVLSTVIIPNARYNAAVKLYHEGKYEEAAEAFEALEGYKDSEAQIYAIKEIKYGTASELYNAGKYEEAIEAFRALDGYRDSTEQIKKCENAIKYNAAVGLYNTGKYDEAITAFESLNGFKDSNEQIKKCETAIKDPQYNAAVELYNAKKYEEAITAFESLSGYKDSTTKAKEVYSQYEVEKVKAAEIGDYIVFGSYYQGYSASSGKKDVEWLVLAKEGNRALVISRYVLDCQQYNTSKTDVTWETCSLRKWLNETFLNDAFSREEQKHIQITNVTADKNPSYTTPPGNNTTDKVFLLSIAEANKYFKSDSARKCAPTYYSDASTVLSKYTVDGKPTCCWWLRSPGLDSRTAAGVGYGGAIDNYGGDVNGSVIGIRPAMWISLD